MAHNGMGVAIVDTDWQNFLLPGSDIPPDVSFLVKDATDGESGSYKSIGAHKLLLAGSSPVFRGQFFGPMKETGDVVEVKNHGRGFWNHDQIHLQEPGSKHIHPWCYQMPSGANRDS